MLSVHTAFSDRASALLTVQTLMSDLASLQSRIEKLEATASKIFGGNEARLRRIEELRETIRATEDAKFCALREYERIKIMNVPEQELDDHCCYCLFHAFITTPLTSYNSDHHFVLLMQNQFHVVVQ